MTQNKSPAKRKAAAVRVRSGNFTAAGTGRLMESWKARSMPMDMELAAELPLLRARSRELARNNPLINRWLSLLKSNVIGHKGFNVQFRGKNDRGELDENDNRYLERSYRKWGLQADVTGKLRRVDLENLFIQNVARDGEFLAIQHTGGHNDDNYALQVLDPDSLDDRLESKFNGNAIRLGVEVNEFGRAVAYHIRQQNPSSLTYHDGGTHYLRVPAERVIHKFMVERAGQNRGYPWAAPVMADVKNTAGYIEAATINKRVASSKMGFITMNAEGLGFSGEDLAEDDDLTMDAEAGTIEQLPFGADFKSWNPTDDESFKEFINTVDQRMSAGLNMNSPVLTSNYADVNFSSIRAARNEDIELFKGLQQWVIDNFCRPVALNWLKHHLLYNPFNTIPLYRLTKYSEMEFIGRRWESVQPKDDAETLQLLHGMGATTLSDYWLEKGLDPEEQWLKVTTERARMKELGLLNTTPEATDGEPQTTE